MASPLCQVLHLTRVDGDVECDWFVPAMDTDIFRLWVASTSLLENGLRIRFETYFRRSPTIEALSVQSLYSKSALEVHEVHQYLGSIDNIIKTGEVNAGSTGTGTISKFWFQRVFWRGVEEEILWFIRGSTNAKVLHEKSECMGWK